MLKIENLDIKRGDRHIINNVSFEVKDGEIFGILGPNGAGKSSLAHIIMGSSGYHQDSGKIFFDGQEISNKTIDQRARMGITLAWQEPARFEGLSVYDYILIGGKEKNRSAASDLLEKVNLAACDYEKRSADKTLSGGERKKIELCSMLAMRPKLALLDEPDSGIDILSQDSIVWCMKEIVKYGGSVILITHEEDMLKIADRAALMCGGLSFKVGSVDEIIGYYKSHCKPCPLKNMPEIVEGKNAAK